MTIRYVGKGGSDSADGLSWTNRKLTLNGVEDTPVVAGDTVYIGPGQYNETLTADVSGGVSTPITYIGDITGQNTDGVGGVVRIECSDNMQTYTRLNGIDLDTKDYRHFKNIQIEGAYRCVRINVGLGHEFDDCVFINSTQTSQTTGQGCGVNIIMTSATQGGFAFRRCLFMNLGSGIGGSCSGSDYQVQTLVDSCVFINCFRAFTLLNQGNYEVLNCTFLNCYYCVNVNSSVNDFYVYGCIFSGCNTVYNDTLSNNIITEDYNLFVGCLNLYYGGTTTIGSNSLEDVYGGIGVPSLKDGYEFPTRFFGLNARSVVAHLTPGSSPDRTLDFWGKKVPSTAAKKSWGAEQIDHCQRATSPTYLSSPASVQLDDMSVFQMIVPAQAASTTFKVRVYRESDYAGTLPQLVVRQPGQTPSTDTDTGSAGAWNELSIVLTPASAPPWVIVECVSNNTATSGNYKVYFDSIEAD